MSLPDLIEYRKNRYSQNGEDGVIAEICRRWGVTSGWFCEFGAWDGKYGSNCYSLLLDGWRGVMIEGEEDRFKVLQRMAGRYQDRLVTRCAFVMSDGGPNSLDNLLRDTGIPREFEVLSIDIDSYDYHVWQSFTEFRPRLVIIEIDSSTLPGEHFIHEGTARLTSFSAMVELAARKDYSLVCHTGNLFFVANEHLEALQIDPDLLAHPERLFIRDWVNPTRMSTFARKVRNMTWQRAVTKVENNLREMMR